MTGWAIFAAMAALFLALLVVERPFPLRERRRSFLPRLAVNLVLAASAFLVASKILTPAALAVLGRASTKPLGLLGLLETHRAAEAVLGFLLMDLSFYYWHLANHRIRLLWRFHNVHHIDPDLDVSTAVRFHFGEMLMSVGFRMLQVTAIGMPATVYFVYEAVFQANTLFHHSNVRLPIGIERFLNKVLVAPRMHAIHHSAVEDETNSNYSTIFSWWDRLHGSLRLNVPQSRITIGVPAYLNQEDNTMWKCLTLPMRRQRDYWRFPDGTLAVRDPAVPGPERSRLAE
jgi:sterol desaturase/sphingolipid hydroxylase (fatty acid hydroxylase superfamily)